PPDEPQRALRRGRLRAPRLARVESGALVPPAGERAWHLGAMEKGTLEDLALVPSSAADLPLEPEEVRIAVHAAGLNFRDVLIALGMYPGDAPIGSEAAGVVLEAGSDVQGVEPGDRVMGFMADAFGTVAVADSRLVVRMPDGWSFEQ